jgi:hypothetical protein
MVWIDGDSGGIEGIPVTRGDISAAVTLVGNVTYCSIRGYFVEDEPVWYRM